MRHPLFNVCWSSRFWLRWLIVFLLAVGVGMTLALRTRKPAALIQARVIVLVAYADASASIVTAQLQDVSDPKKTFKIIPGVQERKSLIGGRTYEFLVQPLDSEGNRVGSPERRSLRWPQKSGETVTIDIQRPERKPKAISGQPAAVSRSTHDSRLTTHDSPPLTICIDPGHPSEINDGLTVVNGTNENHCNWLVALRLQKLLEKAGYRIVMTKREEKQMVTNRERAEIANESHAVVMARLHCDYGSGTGFRVFYPDHPGTHEGTTGPTATVCRKSRVAAEAIRAGLAKTLGDDLRDGGVLTDRSTKIGSRYGALIGSIYSQVPTVTVEMVFLSNSQDAAFIKSEAGQQKIAEGLADGIQRYVSAPLHGKGDARE